jgi:hypothetical protein
LRTRVSSSVRYERSSVVGWKAEARRIYENRVIDDALDRLRGAGLKDIPLSQSELRTLAVRTRQAIFGSPHKRQRLDRYQRHLAKNYGPDVISRLSLTLEEINNQIAYEEK